MADGRASGLQVTPPAGSDAVAGMSAGKSEGEADETLMWDVALVFNPPYISKMPLAVASLEARVCAVLCVCVCVCVCGVCGV